ncbi:MAG: hypothetical protein AAGG44_14380 [Planctomycetota bacterium]
MTSLWMRFGALFEGSCERIRDSRLCRLGALRLLVIWLVAFALGGPFSIVRADEDEGDELPEFMPGLLATFESEEISFRKAMTTAALDAKVDRIDDRLPEGEFKVAWRGLLRAKADGDFGFAFYGRGALEVLVQDKLILKQTNLDLGWYDLAQTELDFGQHPIEIRYAGKRENARLHSFWQGPGFWLEPLESRHLWYETEEAPKNDFENGALLSRGLRCGACHGESQDRVLVAPSLTDTAHLDPSWMVQHLTERPSEVASGKLERKMPFFNMSRRDAETLAWALKRYGSDERNAGNEVVSQKGTPQRKRDENQTHSDGQQLIASVGCLACHDLSELRVKRSLPEQLFGGGDLSEVGLKRGREYLLQLLADPQRVDHDHRMPQPKLSKKERVAIVDYLESLSQGKQVSEASMAENAETDSERVSEESARAI